MPSGLAASLAIVAVSCAVYAILWAGFVWGLVRPRRAPAFDRPPFVSILKPLAGRDDELEENLASFAAIDYPRFEVLLGVADVADPAVAAAHRFLRAHRGLRARMVLTDPAAAHNPKVAQLIGLERAAAGEVIVISDSNVRVGPGYLDPLVAELSRPGVGMASNVVVGTGERSIGAALENLQLGSQIAPAVLSASALLDLPLTIGKSMAMWRRDLEAIGGFAAVGAVLAEDHVLAARFRAAGRGVRVSAQAVENRNTRCGLRRTIERHTRWARMRRSVAPLAFAAEPFWSPLVVAAVAASLAPSAETLRALLGAAALQLAGSFGALWVLRRTRPAWSFLALEPLRAAVLTGCWLAGWLGRRVSWRGHHYLLGPGSVLTPTTAPPSYGARATA